MSLGQGPGFKLQVSSVSLMNTLKALLKTELPKRNDLSFKVKHIMNYFINFLAVWSDLFSYLCVSISL